VNTYGLTYPIVQDNDFTTRKNYNNQYRPAKYIIDKKWNIRYTHFGEWKYEEIEQVVKYLLEE
jgi:peroxiredoxin